VVLVPMRHHRNDLVFSDFSVRDQGVGGSNPLAPTILSPQIQQLHAAFLEATAARFGCESCETLAGRTKPRPILSHHSRRYFTSSRSCSAYWPVRSLCACPIHIFSRSHGTRFLRSQDGTEAAEGVEAAFFSAHGFQNRMKTVAQNIPLRQRFTTRCLKEVSRFLEALTCDVAFDRVR
jgi:hypothetical protein